jgi:hypothetical protein
LARVDALLDDPAFFTRFVPFFDRRMGRQSIQTYLPTAVRVSDDQTEPLPFVWTAKGWAAT